MTDRPNRAHLQAVYSATLAHVGRLAELAAGGVTSKPTDSEIQLASHYEAEAGKLRRRSKRPGVDVEELDKRAGYFEARARVLRAGAPMPFELRTEAETLSRVDEYRRALVRLSEDFADVREADRGAFRAALKGQAHETTAPVGAHLWAEIHALGVSLREDGEADFLPFRSPADGTLLIPVDGPVDAAHTDEKGDASTGRQPVTASVAESPGRDIDHAQVRSTDSLDTRS